MTPLVKGNVSVVVGTYGLPEWVRLAQRRAIPSAQELGVPVIHRHGSNLAQARNEGLALVKTEWVIHLDADDELEPGYVEAMMAGSADLRAPSVRYVQAGKLPIRVRPYMPTVAGHRHVCEADCLPEGNWLVVGSMVRTELVRKLGWRDWPVYEDWCLWLRCHLAGASIEAIPNAIYRAHVRRDSRNRGMPMEERNRWHHEIVSAAHG